MKKMLFFNIYLHDLYGVFAALGFPYDKSAINIKCNKVEFNDWALVHTCRLVTKPVGFLFV